MAEQDYITNTYNALKDKVQGFNKTEQEYRDLVTSDPNYRLKVHKALTDKVDGFNRTTDEFDDMLGLKKKGIPEPGSTGPQEAYPVQPPIPGPVASAPGTSATDGSNPSVSVPAGSTSNLAGVEDPLLQGTEITPSLPPNPTQAGTQAQQTNTPEAGVPVEPPKPKNTVSRPSKSVSPDEGTTMDRQALRNQAYELVKDKPAAAMAVTDVLLQRYPDDPYAYQLKAHQLELDKDYKGAATELTKAINTNPDDADLRAKRADLAVKAGMPQTATEDADAYIKAVAKSGQHDEQTAQMRANMYALKGDEQNSKYWNKVAEGFASDRQRNTEAQLWATLPDWMEEKIAPIMRPLTMPADMIGEGGKKIAEGVEQASPSKIASGIVDAGFGIMMSTPQGVVFNSVLTAGEELGFKELSEWVFAPVSMALERNGISTQQIAQAITPSFNAAFPSTAGTQEAQNATDLAIQVTNLIPSMLLMHNKNKGVDMAKQAYRTAEKWMFKLPVDKIDVAMIDKTLTEITPEETIQAVETTAEFIKDKAEEQQVSEVQQTISEPTYRIGKKLYGKDEFMAKLQTRKTKNGIEVVNDPETQAVVDDMFRPKVEQPVTTTTEPVVSTEPTTTVTTEPTTTRDKLNALKKPVEEVAVAENTGAEPIRQLGTGANVYYETPKLRVNETSDGKVVLNISDNTDSPFPSANIPFDNATEAVSIAERVNKLYPDGVPQAVLIDKVVANMRKDPNYPQQPSQPQPDHVAAEQSVTTDGKMNESWYAEFERAKNENDLPALDILYNKVKVALNGIAQGKGEETVRQFESLKKDMEDYANELKSNPPPTPEPVRAEATEPAEQTDNIYYHGSDKKITGSPKLGRVETMIKTQVGGMPFKDLWDAFYITKDQEWAKFFSPKKGKIYEVKISNGAKILDLSIIAESTHLKNKPLLGVNIKQSFPFQKEFEDYGFNWLNNQRTKNGKAPLSKEEFYKKELHKSLDPSTKEWWLDGFGPDAFVDYVKDNGYDAVKFGREIAVLNPSVSEFIKDKKISTKPITQSEGTGSDNVNPPTPQRNEETQEQGRQEVLAEPTGAAQAAPVTPERVKAKRTVSDKAAEQLRQQKAQRQVEQAKLLKSDKERVMGELENIKQLLINSFPESLKKIVEEVGFEEAKKQFGLSPEITPELVQSMRKKGIDISDYGQVTLKTPNGVVSFQVGRIAEIEKAVKSQYPSGNKQSNSVAPPAGPKQRTSINERDINGRYKTKDQVLSDVDNMVNIHKENIAEAKRTGNTKLIEVFQREIDGLNKAREQADRTDYERLEMERFINEDLKDNPILKKIDEVNKSAGVRRNGDPYIDRNDFARKLISLNLLDYSAMKVKDVKEFEKAMDMAIQLKESGETIDNRITKENADWFRDDINLTQKFAKKNGEGYREPKNNNEEREFNNLKNALERNKENVKTLEENRVLIEQAVKNEPYDYRETGTKQQPVRDTPTIINEAQAVETKGKSAKTETEINQSVADIDKVVDEIDRKLSESNTNAQPIATAAKATANKLRSLKIDKGLNEPNTMGISDAELWNRALDIAADVIEATGDYAQAIADGLKVITNKEDRDKFKASIEGLKEPTDPNTIEQTKTGSGTKDVRSEHGSDTSLKNEQTEKEITERHGVEKVEELRGKLQDTNLDNIYKEAQDAVNNGSSDPKSVAKRIIKNKTGTAQDEAVLLYDRAKMRNRELELINEISNAENPSRAQDELLKLYNDMADNDLAAHTIGREASNIFRLRQSYVDSEYSLYSMEREYAASKGLSDITPEESELIKKQYQEIKAAEAKVRELENNLATERQKLKDQELINAIRTDIAKNNKYKPEYKDVKKRFEYVASQIEKGLIGQDIMMSSIPFAKDVWNIGVKTAAETVRTMGDVAQAVVNGLAKIRESEWYKGLSEENKAKAESRFSESIKGSFRDVNNEIKTQRKPPSKVKPFASEATDGKLKISKSLIKSFVEDGIDNIDDLTIAVKNAIIEAFPDATEREVRDAITGYGKVLNMSKDEVDVTLRKLNRMGKLVSGMEDVQRGKRPLRSGMQRDKPDVEERTKRKELQQLVKDLPMDEADLETYQKSALDAIKTRLNNRIEELQNEINTRQKAVKTKRNVQLDTEAEGLMQIRDDLKKRHDEVFGKPELTYQQRIDLALNGIDRSMKDIDKRIAENDLAKRKKPKGVTSPELEAKQTELKQKRAELEALRQSTGIAQKEYDARMLDAIKKRTETLQAKIDAKDYTTKPKVERARSQEVDDAMVAYKKLQLKWKLDRQKDILSKRPGFEKFVDKSLKVWTGMFLLSGIKTIAKLALYTAMEVFYGEPVDILTTAAAKLFIPGLARKTMTEGYVDWASRKEFYKTLVAKQTWKEAYHYAKERDSYIDNLYGDINKKMPEEFTLNFGKLHGVEKYPLRKSDFAKNFIRLENWYRREGYDTSDPAIRKLIGAMAYDKANYRIMMNRNFLSNTLRDAQSMMLRRGTTMGKIGYYVSKVMFPIISVPTNYTIRTARAWGGLGEFTARVIKDGYGKMTPEQAESAVLAFKNGLPGIGLGIMVLSTGLIDVDDKDDMYVGGWKVPRYLTHHPHILAVKLFAEAKHAYKKKGAYEAIATPVIKTVQETPYLSERTLGILDSPSKLKTYIQNLVISFTQPQLIKDVASFIDPTDQTRRPNTFTDRLKMGVPKLRESVPVAGADPKYTFKYGDKKINLLAETEDNINKPSWDLLKKYKADINPKKQEMLDKYDPETGKSEMFTDEQYDEYRKKRGEYIGYGVAELTKEIQDNREEWVQELLSKTKQDGTPLFKDRIIAEKVLDEKLIPEQISKIISVANEYGKESVTGGETPPRSDIEIMQMIRDYDEQSQ